MDRDLISVVTTCSRGKGCIAKRHIKKGQCLVREDAIALFKFNSAVSSPAGVVTLAANSDIRNVSHLCAQLLLAIDGGKLSVDDIYDRFCRPTDDMLRSTGSTVTGTHAYIDSCARSALAIHEHRRQQQRLGNAAAAASCITLDLCIGLMYRICCNVFTVALNNTNGDDAVAIGMYPDAALLNHCCCPNTVQSFRQTNSGFGYQIQIRANRDIFAGEELYISYLDIGEFN